MVTTIEDLKKINPGKYDELVNNNNYDLSTSDIEDYFTEHERMEGPSVVEISDVNAITEGDMAEQMSLEGLSRKIELIITNAYHFNKEQVVEYGLKRGLVDGRERSEYEIAGILNKKAVDVKKDIQEFNDKFIKFVLKVKTNELENYGEKDCFVENIEMLSKSSLCDPNFRLNNGYADFLERYIPTIQNENVKGNLTKIYNNCKEKETAKDL